ncbi:glycosyltransferase family 4 protein [Pseudomaricurvus alkylphenolicus]|jgi:glycosyltransferase involved in cell wall biosynthesis|nr:glycosyltransferase family 4 protein [Pseudomaricurvus alkylphenolicus]NIB43038.1 glycosyltransferase family 4 protein [Pseudomaricurvus alkylphenolicus]
MTAQEKFPDPLMFTAADPLRICLLGYRSHPFVGGQGVYLKYLSKALVDAGHTVDVISGPPYPELDPRVTLIRQPSLDLFAVDNHVTALRPRHLTSWSDFFEWWSMLTGGFAEPYTFSRRVAKYLKTNGHKYDLVHDNQCLGWGLLTLQKRGLPTVATIHHPITRDRQLALDAAPNWKHRLLVRRWHSFLGMQKKVAQQLNHVVTVSEQSRKDISEAFDRDENDISLVYNGIDTETFIPRPHIATKPFRVMTTASADQPLKGLRYLLQAIAALKPEYPEIELLVVGKLKEGGQTERQLQKLQLQDSVRFVSGISTDELVDFYNEAAVVVSPSLYEGFGLPAGEAMACGCAVISSDGGALPEVVGDAGVVVPAGDSHALQRALQKLLGDPEQRRELGRKGRQRILERFCWKVAAREFTHYYNQVLGR